MKLYMRNVNLGTAPVEDIVVPDIGQATARARGPDCILLTNLDCAICQFEVEMNEGLQCTLVSLECALRNYKVYIYKLLIFV